MDHKLAPVLKYPGSKWNLAPWIISHFPEHVHYVEPYMGSAAVFFQKNPSIHEVLNDLSGSVVNLFRVIRDRGDELAAMIEMTPWSEEEYHELALKAYDQGDDLERARRFLIRSWQSHGSKLSQNVGWKHIGAKGNATTYALWNKLPERLLAVVDRLKMAEIRNRPALEIIKSYNAADVLIYADPPYPLETRNKRTYYLHEMTDNEHIELLELLKKHRGSVVLSGYDHPLYNDRLSDWHRVAMQSAGEHGKQHVEVLWMNFEPQARQLSLFGEEGVG